MGIKYNGLNVKLYCFTIIFKIDKITQDPDPNCTNIQDPNSMYLIPQHCTMSLSFLSASSSDPLYLIHAIQIIIICNLKSTAGRCIALGKMFRTLSVIL